MRSAHAGADLVSWERWSPGMRYVGKIDRAWGRTLSSINVILESLGISIRNVPPPGLCTQILLLHIEVS